MLTMKQKKIKSLTKIKVHKTQNPEAKALATNHKKRRVNSSGNSSAIPNA
jgi:hypothetical protein